MGVPTVLDYYNQTMPRGEALFGSTKWKLGASPDVSIQPPDPQAYFVGYLKLLVTNNFAMSVADEIRLTINAYGNLAPHVTTIVGTGVVADDLAAILALGDPELSETKTIGAVTVHSVVIKFKPPVYLRSSTTPAESVLLEYDGGGGGITAGSIVVSYEIWNIAEDDSGV